MSAAGGAGAASGIPETCGEPGSAKHPTSGMSDNDNIGLSLSDNLHDGYGGFRNKAADTHAVRTALTKVFKRIEAKYLGKTTPASTKADDFTPLLKATMSDKVKISHIEDSTISHFEDTLQYLQPLLPDAHTTYDAITGTELAEATAKAISAKYDTYQLLPGSRTIQEYVDDRDSSKKNKITDFILTFLLGTNKAPTYMTFDASPKSVGKLFRDHPTVSGLVIPQNIGDSASTSFKQLGSEPNLYIFPSSVGYDEKRFYAKRNILSNDKLRIFYQNDGFCSKFPYKISFGLETVSESPKDEKVMSYEKEGYTQGPSLDYLIDLMCKSQGDPSYDFKYITTTSSCLRIGDIINPGSPVHTAVRETEGGVFMDIKRGGDQDVADAVLRLLCSDDFKDKHIIVVTIDRLCSLLLRLLGIPCIYHYGDELTLYKNMITAKDIDPKIIDEKFVEKYEPLVKAYMDNSKINNLKNFICSFRDHIHIFVPTKAKPLQVLQILQRNKFVDMYNYLKNVYDLTTSIPLGDTPKTQIENFLSHFKNIDTKFLIGLKQILDESSIFNKDKDYGYLNYSTDMYNQLNDAYKAFNYILERTRRLREPENYIYKLNKEDGFNTLLKAYTNTFFDAKLGNNAYEALSFNLPAATTATTVATGAGAATAAATGNAAAVAEAEDAVKAITVYEDNSKIVTEIKGQSSANAQKARKALNTLRTEAIHACETIRNILKKDHNIEQAAAIPLPDDWCPASETRGTRGAGGAGGAGAAAGLGQGGGTRQNGGARQRGGAYKKSHVELFKDICERAATFINSEIGRIYPEAIERFAIDQLLDALNEYKKITISFPEKITIKRITRVKISYEFVEAHITNTDVKNKVNELFDESNKIVESKVDEIIASLMVNQSVVTEGFSNVEDLIYRVPDSSVNSMLTELDMIWSTREPADISTGTAAVTLLLDPYAALTSADTVPTPAPAPDAAVYAKTVIENAVKTDAAAAGADDSATTAAAAGADGSAATAAAAAAAAVIAAVADNGFAAANAAGLKPGYPLLFIGSRSSVTRLPFLKKILGSDPDNGIYGRVAMYSLITLAFFDDLFKGNVGKRTSLLISRIGTIPPEFKTFDITTEVQWERLEYWIQNILIQIDKNKLSKEGLRLMTGGGHSSVYSKRKNVTRRKGRRGMLRKTYKSRKSHKSRKSRMN